MFGFAINKGLIKIPQESIEHMAETTPWTNFGPHFDKAKAIRRLDENLEETAADQA